MSSLTVRLFGSPQIELDGAVIHLDHRKPLALLIYLAVTAQPHTRDALATFFWPEYPNARAYLRNNLSIIRRALGDAHEHWVRIGRQTVEWQGADDAWIDVAMFEQHRLVVGAHGHPDGELCTSCIDHFSAAVTLAGDEFLAGFTLRDSPPFDEWSYFRRERLRTTTAEALAALAASHSKSGDLKSAIDYARRRLALDPLHEPAHRQLMELYARDGQQSLAMHQYEECVRFLRAELDVDPSTETTALFETIRRREFSETAVVSRRPTSQVQDLTRAETRETAPIPLPPNNLPAPLTSLIGRQQDLAELRAMLVEEKGPANIRLLTLTGPGGVGKTRLSQAAAADVLPHFDDGVYFVMLASIRRPDLLPSVIAETLGIPLAPERSIMETLTIALRGKRMLLVLDNFEHVLAIAPVVTDLLRACPRLTVLATSREALRLSGEHEFVVRPLMAPEGNDDQSIENLIHGDAIQLFAQRARQARHDFTLDAAGAPIAAQICRRLDGLPLAIELAAARTRHFTLPALLSQLNGVSGKVGHEGTALHLLKDAKRDVSERHHSLRTAIAWSYDLLTVEEQALFRRLSVFVGGWTAETAAAICGHGLSLDIWDGLASLLDKHLITRDDDGSPEPRFAMLETLREFGLDCLREANEKKEENEETIVRARMVETYVVDVEKLNAEMRGPRFVEANESLRREHANIRVVLDWAIQQQNVYACMRLCVALLSFWNSHLIEADQAADTTLKLAEGEKSSVAYAALLTAAGYYAFQMGRQEIAYQRLQRSLEMNDQIAGSISPFLKGIALGITAWILFYRGEYTSAEPHLREAIEDAQLAGDTFSLAMAETNLGGLLALQGKFEEAEGLVKRALQRQRDVGQAWGIAKTLNDLGLLHVHLARYSEAAHALMESLSLSEAHQLSDLATRSREYLALLAMQKADFAQAAQLLEEATATRHRRGGSQYLIDALELVIELAVCTGNFSQALRLASAAAMHRSLLEITVAPVPGATLKRVIAEARSHLGPAASAQAWDEGATLSLDNATDLAIRVCQSI